MTRQYNFQINLKQNIREFTQALARFFKGKKTTRSSQWSNPDTGKCHCWSNRRFNFWTTNNAMLFADDTSLFFVIHNSQTSAGFRNDTQLGISMEKEF